MDYFLNSNKNWPIDKFGSIFSKKELKVVLHLGLGFLIGDHHHDIVRQLLVHVRSQLLQFCLYRCLKTTSFCSNMYPSRDYVVRFRSGRRLCHFKYRFYSHSASPLSSEFDPSSCINNWSTCTARENSKKLQNQTLIFLETSDPPPPDIVFVPLRFGSL